MWNLRKHKPKKKRKISVSRAIAPYGHHECGDGFRGVVVEIKSRKGLFVCSMCGAEKHGKNFVKMPKPEGDGRR